MQLIFLLTLHHIADTAFQPDWMIRLKKIHWFTVYEHCFVWAGVVSLGLYAIGEFALWKFFFLLIGHFIIDLYKYQYAKNKDNYSPAIYIDQALHYGQVAIVWYI